MLTCSIWKPVPCGFSGDPQRHCTCQTPVVQKYRSRISGPLLDRIDIHVEVPAVRYRDLAKSREGEPSAAIRLRVGAAREIQRRRFVLTPRVHCNAQMGPRAIRHFCEIGSEGQQLLASVIDRLGMSARAHDRILKMARTIADLAGSDAIEVPHLAEAIQYRTLDRAVA